MPCVRLGSVCRPSTCSYLRESLGCWLHSASHLSPGGSCDRRAKRSRSFLPVACRRRRLLPSRTGRNPTSLRGWLRPSWRGGWTSVRMPFPDLRPARRRRWRACVLGLQPARRRRWRASELVCR
ncbi:HNH endonuclease [Xanthomonas phage M29]|nr:HNH endonuclease [Xanthomonas phage M29]